MNKKQQKTLSDIAQISRQYQRSIRVDTDIGRVDALSSYICHASASSVINGICKQLSETNQRCFTWTGPFGGGKSSLAVALASTLHTNEHLRGKAREVLQLDTNGFFDKSFPVRDGWLIVPVVGRRSSVITDLHTSLRKAQGKTIDNKINAKKLIDELLHEASTRPHDGVLVIIDEMGKFLEASALGVGDDVYFFQELAEAAARSEGRLVIIGVLHQSFAQYAARLGIDTRDDWTKVQGRYIDLPLVTASDEVVELIGRAIETKTKPEWMIDASKTIAHSIRARRPAVGKNFSESLARCWPLHPAMAALLGPISKRQFGQNERSTFGFLSSVEANGFGSYLNSTPFTKGAWYRPSDYWDYLRANMEPAILASPDGHRWSQAVEAVERAEIKTDDQLAVTLLKNIAIIDLFRNGSGMAADTAIIGTFFPENTPEEIQAALQKLSEIKVAIFKNYTDAWSVFEGSDFDIEAAIRQALATSPSIDYARLSKLMGLRPVVAKRHYHSTGTMRWMDLHLCSIAQAEKLSSNFIPRKGEFGVFILAFPDMGMHIDEAIRRTRTCAKTHPWPVVVGIPDNHARIAELSKELLALELVSQRHELHGDSVARREVNARLTAVNANLEDQLQLAISLTSWYDSCEQKTGTRYGAKLSPVASELAENLYRNSVSIWSELVNRDSLSSNSVKARKNLLHAMINSENLAVLGYEGFPAERGLYETLLRNTGLHQQDLSGSWQFTSPPDNFAANNLTWLWQATRELFSDASVVISVKHIYDIWSAPPYGMKQGILPVVFTAFILAHKYNIAVYKDGIFVSQLSDFDIDECLQDPSRFSLRWVVIDENKTRILDGISKLLLELDACSGSAEPLNAARGLVTMIFNLPGWTRRTQKLSATAKAIRDMLLKASDPHKVLFVDLPYLLGASDSEKYINALYAPLEELSRAYSRMLEAAGDKMIEYLDADFSNLESLRTRARSVSGISGDFRLDAFATRLANFDGGHESLEGILSLAAETPPRDWVDRHIDAAYLELAKFSQRFRETEAFVSVQGREPHSEAIAVVIGTGLNSKMISRSFSISDRHRDMVENQANNIVSSLTTQGLKTDVLLAILAKAGMKLACSDKEQANG